MSYSPHIPVARIYLDRICRNFKRIRQATGNGSPGGCRLPARAFVNGADASVLMDFSWPGYMPVVKADAYGHGHVEVAVALAEQGARIFASGSIEETMLLQQGLRDKFAGINAEQSMPAVLSLLGVVHAEDARMAADSGMISMLHTFEQIELLSKYSIPMPVAIKCNTGMSRLGFGLEDMDKLIQALRANLAIVPVLAISHLASADSEQGKQEIERQAALFTRMLERLRREWPGLVASLGNSAGTLLCADVTKAIGSHLCRPGVTLYGGNPFVGTSHESLASALEEAMEVSTPIIALRELKAGQGIGYGHTFVASRDMRVAIIAVGYADCYTRSMSSKGVVCIRGERAPVIGRVSMQMTAVDVSGIENIAVGDDAWLLGGPFENKVTAAELAQLWGTITYEVFCLLGFNKRVYVDG